MSRRESGSLDILHLDMDCFYAAVEVLDDPTLVSKPVVVCGVGPRGVVAAASYEARSYGVRSAMPTSEARRRCPVGVFISPRHSRYSEVSGELMTLLKETTPLVEPLSLDEAYLDISGGHRLLGTSEEIAHRLRAEVRVRLDLSCSVGVGRSKLVAKLASRAAKPPIVAPRAALLEGPGVVVVSEESERDFLGAHRIGAIPGIGPRTAEALARLGVESVSDLARIPRERLEHRFGRARGRSLCDLAQGLDARRVEPERATKSIGHEETFDVDVGDDLALRGTIRRQSEEVIRRCRAHGVEGRTVTLKIRYGDFTTITRSHSEPAPFLTGQSIARAAEKLLDALEERREVRLLGVSVSSLEPVGSRGRQLDLFGAVEIDEPNERRLGAEVAADEVRRRFGSDAILAPGRGLTGK